MKEIELYESFEEFVKDTYKELTVYEKIMFHLQDNVIKILIFSFLLGYYVA